MKSLLFPSAFAVLTHLSVLATNFVYSPARYEVMSAAQSVELALESGVQAPSVAEKLSEQPARETPLTPPLTLPSPKGRGEKGMDCCLSQRERESDITPALSRHLTDYKTEMCRLGRDAIHQQESTGSSAAPLAMAGNRPPKYPKLARKMGYEGTVVLGVSVNFAGEATQVLLQKSSGHKILDDAAIQAISKWRFQPARRFGMPVASTIFIPVVFNLKEL